MTKREMRRLMKQFVRGFATIDADLLRGVLSDDFEWHMHYGRYKTHRPTGKVLKGVDGMIKELKWRRKNWRNVKFSDVVERPAGDVILQMFTISGTDENGNHFHNKVVDVYPVRDGKIIRKDTYWKQV